MKSDDNTDGILTRGQRKKLKRPLDDRVFENCNKNLDKMEKPVEMKVVKKRKVRHKPTFEINFITGPFISPRSLGKKYRTNEMDDFIENDLSSQEEDMGLEDDTEEGEELEEEDNECHDCEFCDECYEVGIREDCQRCRLCDNCDSLDGRVHRHFKNDKYYQKLDPDDQEKYFNSLMEIRSVSHSEIPFKYKILETSLSISNKSIILDNINHLEHSCGEEQTKLKKWVDGISKVPFGKYIDLPVSLNDEPTVIGNFLSDVYQKLNQSIYGQEKAKNILIETIGQWIRNPQSQSNIIGIYGPPGIGKTSLIKDGLSQALNKPFSFIALGGAKDSSVLDGHGFTYVGATWGSIIQILMDSQCMNPIIYLDELDKVADNDKGQEIINVLMHLIDSAQNTCYHDNFFTGIDFDLSKVLFIFSYNDDSKINYILGDRITKIKLDGFDLNQKMIIAKKYLVPRVCQNIGFQLDTIMFPNEVLQHMIMRYTNEKGVRRIKELINKIYMKINLYQFVENQPDLKNIYKLDNISLPLVLNNDIVDSLLDDSNDGLPDHIKAMYI